MDLVQILIVLLLGSILVCGLWEARARYYVLEILNRWLRWVLFALVVAYFAKHFNWTFKPYWLLVLVFFLGWFVLETVYNWVIVAALSRSNIPLFPHFIEIEKGQDWPSDKKYLELKDWIDKKGYKHSQSLKATISDSIVIRSSVFENEQSTRLQVLFIPGRKGAISMCAIFSSVMADGTRYITDNVHLPFGGFYPDNWNLLRRPLVSIKKLLKVHQKRLKESKKQAIAWKKTPLEDALFQQATLENLNIELGFLFPKTLQGDYGRITWEGRYRIWKEMWLLSYFGIGNKYL